MIKLVTLITKFIVVALTALLFASCNHNFRVDGFGKSITGSGNITNENRNIQGNFKSITVSNAIELIVEQADFTEVIVEADDNLQKGIITKVENGVLIIESEYNNFINVKSRKVYVKMPKIEVLEASSAASITSINTLKGDDISLNSSSASTIVVAVEADYLNIDSSSGSSITLNGLALKFKASSSSGSTINAYSLSANEIIADASSGSSVEINPIVSLTAEASSGSNISYKSNPKSVQKSESSGGSISKE